MMNHRIHRQRWQVKAPSPQAAFAIRQQLRDGLESALMPVFERAFDALAPDDEVIHIPRLTLDIRLDDAGDDLVAALMQTLPSTLHDALRSQLDEAMQNAAPPLPAQARMIRHDRDEAEPRPTQRLSAAAHRRHALLHYLATGLLEWHAQHETDILHMLRDEAAALADETATLRDILTGLPAQRHAAAFRLLQLLPAGSRHAVVLALAPNRQRPASQPDDSTPDADAPAELLLQLARLFAPDSPLLLRVQTMLLTLAEAEPDYPSGPFDGELVALLRDCLRQLAAQTHRDAPAIAPRIEALLRADSAPQKGELRPSARAPEPTATPVRQPDAATDAALLTHDAGLILLHPFLPRLFAELDITAGNALPEAQLPRAAALLHDLVFGHEEIHEYQLPLVKVLLGLTPDSLLPVSAGLLDKTDRAEAETLLTAAIAHWNALGKTGVSALRTTFLQRRGLLRDTDSGWQLQVEPAPYDLLLGRLPWSFSIVRLPWMTRPLHTEWPMP